MDKENSPCTFYDGMLCPNCGKGTLHVFGDPDKIVLPHCFYCDSCDFHVNVDYPVDWD